MTALLAQLPGPINLRLVLSDLKFADILHDLVTAKGNRSGVPRVLAVDRNETRELAGTLHLEGASKDDAIAQIRAINALVTVGTTLTLQSTGATNTVTLKVLPSRGVSQPLDELFELPGAPPGANLVAAAPAGSAWPTDWTDATYAPNTGVVALRFDDATTLDFTDTVPLLAAYGLTAGFAVIVDDIGITGHMTQAQLEKTESLGNELMCHSKTHTADPASMAAFYDETVGALASLTALGFNVRSFVQPGWWVAEYNMRPAAGWTMGCPADLLLRANFAAYEGYFEAAYMTLPVSGEDRYGRTHYSPTTAADAINKINGAITYGLAVELLFHSNDIGGAGISAADFDTVLEYIQTKVTAGTLTLLNPTPRLYAVSS